MDLAKDSDLLLAESSFVTGEHNPPDLHMTGREAGSAAQAAGVGRLLLTHVPPWHTRGVAVEEATETYSGTVSAATPGLDLEI